MELQNINYGVRNRNIYAMGISMRIAKLCSCLSALYRSGCGIFLISVIDAEREMINPVASRPGFFMVFFSHDLK